MTLDPRFVASTTLQEHFVDKDTGLNLANGYIEFKSQTDQIVDKPIYQLVEGMSGFTFEELPNPLDLSGVGTTVDESGNYTPIYYFPYDADGNEELYYITVFNEDGVEQEQLQNWPPNAFASSAQTDTGNSSNLVTNGEFLFNAGLIDTSADTEFNLAPGANIGLSNAIRLIKSNTQADDEVEFVSFDVGPQLSPGVSQYLHYTCTNIPTTETFKYIEIPLWKGVNNFNGVEVTLSLNAFSVNLNEISVSFVQNFGTGGSAQDIQLIDTFSLTATNEVYEAVFTINSTESETVGDFQDDYCALRINLELNAINDTAISAIQIREGSHVGEAYVPEVPQSVAGAVFIPMTGDVKTSLNDAYQPGWLLMDDGTIGNSSSNATSRAYNDTFALYSMIWSATSSNLSYALLYESTGELVHTAGVPDRGANAAEDYAANRALSLTKALGRVFAGINPTGATIINYAFTASSSSGLLITVTGTGADITNNLNFGRTVRFSAGIGGGVLPTGITAGTTYYVAPFSSTTFKIATSLNNLLAGTYVAFTNAGTPPNFVFTYGDQIGVLAEPLGESNHTQTEAELATHHHEYIRGSSLLSASGTDEPNPTAGTDDTEDTGASAAFNIMQPTTYMNFYIKL